MVGAVPAGYEIVAWVFAALFTLFLITSAFSIIAEVLRFISGR